MSWPWFLALSLLPPPGPGGWDGNLQRQNIQHRLYHLAAGRFRLGEHRSGGPAHHGRLRLSGHLHRHPHVPPGAYDPSTFNPGVFRDWLDSKGYISHSSDRSRRIALPLGASPPLLSPRFYFVNQTFFSVSTPLADVVTKINDLLNSGYYVIARVKTAAISFPSPDGGRGCPALRSRRRLQKLLSEYNGTIGA